METATNSQRRELLVLLAWCLLLMLAWSLWLYRLDGSDLTFDEAATYSVARRPLLGILDYLRGAVREHPPLYYLLIHGWMALAGTSEFSMRFFSVSAGLIALALTGWLARLTRLSPAVIPAVLLALVPGMAYFARDARMYSLGVVWTTLSAGLFLRDWLPAKGWPRRAAFTSLVTVHCLALFTHYYLLLPILVQPFVLLITRRWRPFLAWCALHGFLALAGLAWLWLSPGLQMTTGSLWPHLALTMPSRFQMFHLLGKILFGPVTQVHFHVLYAVLGLAGVGVLLALWRCRTIGVWLGLVLVLPLALAYLLPQPPVARYLIFLTPLVALALSFLCAFPLDLTHKPQSAIRWLAWGATLALTLLGARLLVVGGLRYVLTFDRSHYSRTLEMVQAHARPGDGVLFYGPWQRIQFRYYNPGGMPPITVLPTDAPPRLKPDEAEPVLEKLLARYEGLWVLPAAVDSVDPPHFVEGWLNTHAHRVWKTGDFSLYLPPLSPDAPSQPVHVVFGESLLLESVAWEPQQLRAGDPLRLTLRWSPLRCLENDVRLTLKLTDGSGYIWDHTRSIPGAWAYPPSRWEPGEVITDYEGLVIPWGAPPGEYTINLMVTDVDSGEVFGGEIDLLKVAVDKVISPPPSQPSDHLDHHVYLPLVFARWPGFSRPPVLYGLPNADAATFCSPDGADCLHLAGYEPGGRHFPQAYPVPLTLHWLSPERPLPELHLRLQIVHRPWLPLPGLRSTPIVTQTLPLAPTYPAPLWSPGRLVTLPAAIMLPSDAQTGPARVTLEVLGPDGTPWPTTEGGSTFFLFNITVKDRPVLRRLPGGLTPIQADFGDEVGLRGYRVEGDIRPGGQLRVTYAWYARMRPAAIYAVFNHLATADGVPVAQADGWPQEGRMLTTQWQVGEYVEDDYTLAIPSDAPPGPYVLYVGIYDAADNERQPAFLDGQRLLDDQLPIPLPHGGRQ